MPRLVLSEDREAKVDSGQLATVGRPQQYLNQGPRIVWKLG